jgi:hypothetical protein
MVQQQGARIAALERRLEALEGDGEVRATPGAGLLEGWPLLGGILGLLLVGLVTGVRFGRAGGRS